MIHRMKRWLAPPVFIDDDEKTRLADVLNSIILALMFLAGLLILGNLLGGKSPLGIYLIDLLVILTGLILRSSLQAGRVNFVGLAMLALGFTFITAAIAIHGTIRTPNTAIYIFLVIIAEVLYGLNGALALTILCSLAVLVFTIAEIFGLIPQDTHTVTFTQWITYTVVFGAIGGLSYAAHRVTQKALVRAHKEIAERKNIEISLRESESRFRSLFEQTHDAVFILDFQGRHQAANQRAADMLGYSLEEILQLSVREISAELNPSLNVIDRLLAGEQVPAYERFFRKKNGQVFPVEINVELVRDKNGAPRHIQSVVTDISQRKLAEEEVQKAAAALQKANEQLSLRVAEVESLQAELREQALHDPLTGLYNRRYLSETMEREITRAERERCPLSVIVSDIDFFKMINDTYGHQIGDKFLVEIARRMKRLTRGSDIVCRYGGEEFLLVLPHTSVESALRRAEEIRQMCMGTAIHHDGQELHISMSFGIATYPDHGFEPEDIIIKADKALYQSKHTGRNQVTVWNHPK